MRLRAKISTVVVPFVVLEAQLHLLERKRFNNHKSSMNRYSKGQSRITGGHPYSNFFETGHKGIEDMRVKIIDTTNVNDPTKREGFWADKLNSFMPHGPNLRNFI